MVCCFNAFSQWGYSKIHFFKTLLVWKVCTSVWFQYAKKEKNSVLISFKKLYYLNPNFLLLRRILSNYLFPSFTPHDNLHSHPQRKREEKDMTFAVKQCSIWSMVPTYMFLPIRSIPTGCDFNSIVCLTTASFEPLKKYTSAF